MISKTGGVIGIISYLTRISTLKRLKNKENDPISKKSATGALRIALSQYRN